MSRRSLILSVIVAVVLGVGIYYLMTLHRHLSPANSNPQRAAPDRRERS